jgi:hypothetical protein
MAADHFRRRLCFPCPQPPHSFFDVLPEGRMKRRDLDTFGDVCRGRRGLRHLDAAVVQFGRAPPHVPSVRALLRVARERDPAEEPSRPA